MSKGSSTLASSHTSTAELHPVLQAALDSLDVELEEELVRYRRQRYRQARQAEPEQIPVWQPPIAQMPSNANPQAPQLPFTSGTSVQNVISRLQQNPIAPDKIAPDNQVLDPVVSNAVAEPSQPIAPPPADLPKEFAESMPFPPAAAANEAREFPHREAQEAQTNLSLATAPVDPDWEELIQAAANPDPVNATQATEFESAIGTEEFESDFNAAAEDYLRSNEELLRSIAEETAEQQSRQEATLLDSLLTPLGVGSMALVLLSSATLGYVIMHPSSLNFLWSSGQVSQSEPSNSGSETFASPLVPDSPNLAADEFVDLNVNNLSTLPGTSDRSAPATGNSAPPALTPTVAPSPTTLNAAPVATAPISEAPAEVESFSIPEPLPPVNAGSVPEPAPEPAYIAPEPPIAESVAPAAPIAGSPSELPASVEAEVATAPVYQNPIDPSAATSTPAQSAGTYYVVTPYSGDPSLQQARETVPDAYVRNFATGASVQLGVFSDQENAQELLQKLEAEGISAEIYQP